MAGSHRENVKSPINLEADLDPEDSQLMHLNFSGSLNTSKEAPRPQVMIAISIFVQEGEKKSWKQLSFQECFGPLIFITQVGLFAINIRIVVS